MNKISVLCVDDVIYLHIDGKLIDYLFDPFEFVLPVPKGEFNLYFFTCSCGVSGCAGWHEGFLAKHDHRTITWTRLDFDKSGIPETCVFDITEYLITQIEVLTLLMEIANRRGRKARPSEEDIEYGIYDFYNSSELDAILARNAEWARRTYGG